MSIAIVGTDTEVGKTVISALVAERFRDQPGIAYWKPVATGCAPDSAMSDDCRNVRDWVDERVTVLPETYVFPEPASPHLASRLAGSTVEIESLDADLARHRAAGRTLVVEGIGGVLVPLNDVDLDAGGYLYADWLATTGLPALVVTRSTLGTINHSLLTLEALRRRGIEIAGVVMNGPADIDNREAVARFGCVAPVFEVTPIDPLDAANLRARAADFDAEGKLLHYMTTSDLEKT